MHFVYTRYAFCEFRKCILCIQDMYFVNTRYAFCDFRKCFLCFEEMLFVYWYKARAMKDKEYIFQTGEDPINLIRLEHTQILATQNLAVASQMFSI